MTTSIYKSTNRIKVVVLRSFLFTYLLVHDNIFIFAQQELNKATLNLINDPVIEGSRIIEFKPSTIILKVKMNNTNQYFEQEISASVIEDILIRYDWSSGRGAVKGLLIGTGIGAAIGSGLYYVGPVAAIDAFATLGTLSWPGCWWQKKEKM